MSVSGWIVKSSGVYISSGVTRGSGNVTLPYMPQTVTDEAATVDDTTINIPEVGTTIVSVCDDVRTLTAEGFFYVAGSTRSAIDNSYVIPLLNMLHGLVTLATPRPSLNAVWKLDKATFIETKDYAGIPAIKYTLVFKYAAEYVVL